MKLHYCPECTAALTQLDSTEYRCSNGHPFHNNPHASCSVALLSDNGEVLVSRRRNPPLAGKYNIPGGFLNYDENAYQAIIREIKEELDITVMQDDLELIDSALHYYEENDTSCDFVFLCRSWDGTISPHDDVTALEWKPIDFVNSEEFAWPYPYLYNKLRKIVNNGIPSSTRH